jgi:hypothetical protein
MITQDAIVRKNIEVFKIILKKASRLYDVKSETHAQSFHAFIHRDRGEIRFASLSKDFLENREWAPISFQFFLPMEKEKGLSLQISNLDSSLFSWQGLEKNALSTLKETIKTMQFMANFLPRLSNLSAILREFSAINLDSFISKLSSKDLIHEAWHSLTKEECEYKLRDHEVGTFLFRKDPFATILEELLSEEHKESIKCITLSYVSSQNNVCDITCVQKKSQWLLYDDDPKLKGPLYPSIYALLHGLQHRLRMPLLQS